MNILFFLTPKNEVAYIYEDETLRQALEKMEHHKYSAVPVINKAGQICGNHNGRGHALGDQEQI